MYLKSLQNQVLYLFLSFWFGRLAYNLFRTSGNILNYGLGVGFAFLSLFMVKSLFFLTKKTENPMRRYLTEKEEPVLFDYLYKLADEASAPRPHRVFLTDRVNASVSYDLSLLNLLFPSKKNLEIGLGLVNVLNLGEFKAVLAHEYGHFAQRSMLLGRYVYVAQQIAARIVGKRDILDKFLSGLSSFDIRIAWIGWILSILVWAIRSLIETCFSVVSIAERALSREMEFQADLVAVSLTGSDALIHALSKLQVADEAYENALNIVDSQLNKKNAIANMYTLQSNYIQKMSWLLDDKQYGKSPTVPKIEPEKNRIFSSRTYNPPKMWATHPADKDREENAKNIYIPAEIDNQSTKSLLSDSLKYEKEMTATLIATAKVETTVISDEESIKAQNTEYFDWSFLNPKYHASFLNRYAFRYHKSIDELYNWQSNNTELTSVFKELYPEDLNVKLNQLKEIHEEINALVISENEVLTSEKRRIWHRGEEIKRREIPSVIKELRTEEEKVVEHLKTHDIKCRRAHYEAANATGFGWGEYLKNLSSIVHYAEHTIVNLNDSARKFHNVLNVVLADGRVSSSELTDVLRASNDYYNATRKGFTDSDKLKLNTKLLQKLNLENYKSSFEEFTLTNPTKENINEWVNVIDGWANSALQNINKLRNVALEHLLDTEDEIRTNYLENKKMSEPAPNGIQIIKDYALLLPGTERSIQRKLNFRDRFFQGDGLVASVAKFAISGSLIFGALFLGSYSQKSELYVYNGIQTAVVVDIDNSKHTLNPNQHKKIDVNFDTDYIITTTTISGEPIETLETDFDDPSNAYIYNIANAGAFIKYPVFYGYDGRDQQTNLGVNKWISSEADYILEEAPESISTSSNNTTGRRDVITAYSNIDPYDLLTIVEDSVGIQKIVTSHVTWDETESLHLISWMRLLASNPKGMDILKNRLAKNKNEIYTLRALQDNADSLQRIKICDEHQKMALKNPDNADFHYLSIRCLDDEQEKNTTFIKGHEKFPQHTWLSFAAAYSYAEREQWQKSYSAFKIANKKNKALAVNIGVDAERVRRVLENKLGINIDHSQRINNETIAAYKEMESGQLAHRDDNQNHVYYLMSQGKLTEAYSFVSDYEHNIPSLLRFLAASEGVDREIVDEALNLDTMDGINFYTIWSAIGVAVNEGKDYDEYLNSIELMGIERKTLEQFIEQLKRLNTKKAETIIKTLDFNYQPYFYTLGAVILRKKAPKHWKTYMNSLLFANEKPFISNH